MNNDAVWRLREPGAWVLLGSVGLQLISGLLGLFFGNGLPFTYRAYNYVAGDQFFTGVVVVGVVLVGVLLATRIGGPPTPQARTIALGGLILLGVIGLVEAIAMLAGLAAGHGNSGVVLDTPMVDKAAMFLYGIAKLGVLGVGAYYVYAARQAMSAAPQAAAPYPPQMYGQQGPAPYGPSQQAQQPYPYGPQGQQPYGRQAPYGGQQPPQYPQPGYGPPGFYPPPGTGPQQPPAGRPGAQPPSPGSQPAASGAQPPSPGAPRQPAAPPGEGEWTRAYGQGDLGRQEPKQGEDDQPGGSDPYRPPQ